VSIKIGLESIERVVSFKYLGLILDDKLLWNEHVDKLCSKVTQRVGLLRRLRPCFTAHVNIANMLYKAMALPLLDYCDTVWDSCGVGRQQQLQVLQNRAARVVLQLNLQASSVLNLHEKLSWQYLAGRRRDHVCIMVYKCINGLAPTYLSSIFSHNHNLHNYQTRQTSLLYKPFFKTTTGQRTFSYRGAKHFNSLPAYIKQVQSLNSFKSALKDLT